MTCWRAGWERISEDRNRALQDGLKRAVQRGTLLKVVPPASGDVVYLLNSDRGRAAARAIAEGTLGAPPGREDPR